jgi:hypothetical protein
MVKMVIYERYGSFHAVFFIILFLNYFSVPTTLSLQPITTKTASLTTVNLSKCIGSRCCVPLNILQSADHAHHHGTVKMRPSVILFSSKLTSNVEGIKDFFGAILRTTNLKDKTDERTLQRLRQERKDELLFLLNSPNIQKNSVVRLSKEIDEAIDALAELSPVSTLPELSQQLEKTWLLVWTTEKEINLFIEQGWSTNITQLVANNSLVNNIPFVNNNGFFGVQGRIFRALDDTPIRTQFVFESATLSFNRSWLPIIQIPPVGKGWFDTVYLDSNFRVDRNSRNDILVCQTLEEA